MAVGGKEAAIGVLVIAVIALAGFTGFMMINPQTATDDEESECEECEECETCPTVTKVWGLPDDWSTAPNASSFKLYNQTEYVGEVTLGDILDGIALYEEQEAAPAEQGDINEYKDIIYPITVVDPDTGLYITGINILDVLEKYDTNFGWDVSFISNRSSNQAETDNIVSQLNTNTGELIYSYWGKGGEEVILALAINKTWIQDTDYYAKWGNFSIISEDEMYSLYDMTDMKVTSDWQIAVKVNGTTEFYIDRNNITINEYHGTYRYDRNDYWNYNREYWGRNISDIVKFTSAYNPAKDLNYTVVFEAVDGWTAPKSFTYSKEYPYNNTQVEQGINPPYTDFVNPGLECYDYVNLTDPEDDCSGVPLPDPNLNMTLCYAMRELGETDGTISDPVWPGKTILGYDNGPFNLIIPGRPRNNYLKWVYEIEFTSYNCTIPR